MEAFWICFGFVFDHNFYPLFDAATIFSRIVAQIFFLIGTIQCAEQVFAIAVSIANFSLVQLPQLNVRPQCLEKYLDDHAGLESRTTIVTICGGVTSGRILL